MCGLGRFGGLLTAAAAISFAASVVTSTSGGASPIYRLKLDPFVAPPVRMVGLIVKARINGGPPLRLLLDSGASMIHSRLEGCREVQLLRSDRL